MARKKLLVAIVAIVLLLVALGVGYLLLTQPPTPSGAAPTVTFTSPAHAAKGVPINTKILARFSEAMDASTITTSTLTLTAGTTAVTGAVTYAGTTATFAPSSNLAEIGRASCRERV